MKKKVGLYDPYLDTLGGGELHVLSILQALDSMGYQTSVFWDNDLTREIKNKFSLQFNIKLEFRPNIFKNNVSILEKLNVLKDFDIFIYVTDGSYFFSSAKRNYVFAMVPDKALYAMSPLNRLKTYNYSFISNSLFTCRLLESWGIPNQHLYPYVNNELTLSEEKKKENIILSVGRFFPHLHTKHHEKTISVFNQLQEENRQFRSYTLVLAGGLKPEDKSYFSTINKLVENNPSIKLIPNIRYADLMKYYRKARFYWHLAGFGVDENAFPYKVEHLGLTPLEAMAARCVTLCYNAGGPKEFIRHGKNGFLFLTESELMRLTAEVIKNPALEKTIAGNARETVKKFFSYDVFVRQVEKLFHKPS